MCRYIENVFISALCTSHSKELPPAAARSNSRPPSVPKRATCGSRAKLVCSVGTTVGHNWVVRSANAHWATPPLLGCRSYLLKRVRFGYGFHTNLFSTTLSTQANSLVQSLVLYTKRKPVHSFHRCVTTKSWCVMGSNLLCRPICPKEMCHSRDRLVFKLACIFAHLYLDMKS